MPMPSRICYVCSCGLRDGDGTTALRHGLHRNICLDCYDNNTYTGSSGQRYIQIAEEDEESDDDPDEDRRIEEYGSGGENCHKVGISIPGLQDCGFELEFLADRGGDVGDVADEIRGQCELASIEHDGSLDDNGAEAVSHYGPIDRISMDLKSVCDVLRKNRCRSHNTRCCGLHVSISKRDLTTVQIARYVVFWNNPKNQEFLQKFARRWDQTFSRSKEEKGKMPDCEIAQQDLMYNHDRYELVNLQNADRLEVRAFKGTTKYETAMACMSLSVWIMAYCKTEKPLVFDRFIEWCRTAKMKRDNSEFRPLDVVEYWDARNPANANQQGSGTIQGSVTEGASI